MLLVPAALPLGMFYMPAAQGVTSVIIILLRWLYRRCLRYKNWKAVVLFMSTRAYRISRTLLL